MKTFAMILIVVGCTIALFGIAGTTVNMHSAPILGTGTFVFGAIIAAIGYSKRH